MPRLIKDDAMPRHTACREALVLSLRRSLGLLRVLPPSKLWLKRQRGGSDDKLSHEGH